MANISVTIEIFSRISGDCGVSLNYIKTWVECLPSTSLIALFLEFVCVMSRFSHELSKVLFVRARPSKLFWLRLWRCVVRVVDVLSMIPATDRPRDFPCQDCCAPNFDQRLSFIDKLLSKIIFEQTMDCNSPRNTLYRLSLVYSISCRAVYSCCLGSPDSCPSS